MNAASRAKAASPSKVASTSVSLTRAQAEAEAVSNAQLDEATAVLVSHSKAVVMLS